MCAPQAINCSCAVLFSIFGCGICVCALKRLKFWLRNLQLRFKLLRFWLRNSHLRFKIKNFWLRNLRLRFTMCFLNAQLCQPHTVEASYWAFNCWTSSREIPIFVVFGLTWLGIKPDFIVSVADALSTRPQNPSWVGEPKEKSGHFHTTLESKQHSEHPITTQTNTAGGFLLVTFHNPLCLVLDHPT